MSTEKRPLGELISGIIKDLGAGDRPTEEDMAASWKTAVGRRASEHSRPVSFRRSSLIVNVDGSPWLYELTLKKKEILKKLGAMIKGRKLKEIRFRIGEVKGGK